MSDNSDRKVSFTAMSQGSRADYELVAREFKVFEEHLADRLLDDLRSLDGPSPYQVSLMGHMLQSATRAEADGADPETIVCCLLHDLGDIYAPLNHSQVIAAIMRPYVSEKNHWVLQHHGLFQGHYYFTHYGRDPDERDQFSDHPHYQATVDFCANWDQNCFDPDYPSKPLEYFEPMVRNLFSKPAAALF